MEEKVYANGKLYMLTKAVGEKAVTAPTKAVATIIPATCMKPFADGYSAHKPSEVVWWSFDGPVKCEECGATTDKFCDVAFGKSVSIIYCYQCAPASVMDCDNTIECLEPVDHTKWDYYSS